MKRRQKRVLQMAFLFTVALVFLPNVGLWSLYKDRHLMKTQDPAAQGFPLGLGDGPLYTWTDGLRRRDWHDDESIRRDELRMGKGERGKPYPLAEDECDDSVYRENGFNIYVSNNIALDRSLPDIRHPICRRKLYLEKLPNTSIIIPFHNEGWSSLLRTIHSIANRTPDSLVAEIILVDDFSDRAASGKENPLRLREQSGVAVTSHASGDLGGHETGETGKRETDELVRRRRRVASAAVFFECVQSQNRVSNYVSVDWRNRRAQESAAIRVCVSISAENKFPDAVKWEIKELRQGFSSSGGGGSVLCAAVNEQRCK